jgi:hypothetical protein
MRKHTVFISYSRKDIDVAHQLAQDLEKAGFDAWWDISDLKGGDAWVRTIQAALKASKYCVVVLSPDAVESEWVEKEYTYAMGLGLKIIPLLYKNCEMPMALANIQYIDFRGKKYKRGLQELFEILRVLAPDEDGARPGLRQAAKRAPAKPRRPVNWERVGAIARVISVLIALGACIALGAWLVPNAADFLSAWLSKTPAATPTRAPTTIAAVTPKPLTYTPTATSTSRPTHTPLIPTATPSFSPAPPTSTPVPPTDTPTPIPPTPTPPPSPTPYVATAIPSPTPTTIVTPSAAELTAADFRIASPTPKADGTYPKDTSLEFEFTLKNNTRVGLYIGVICLSVLDEQGEEKLQVRDRPFRHLPPGESQSFSVKAESGLASGQYYANIWNHTGLAAQPVKNSKGYHAAINFTISEG